ncbi:hypothetical protein CERSUDRAFT_99164 [Gelatoporia subvermispora B]|uniref:Uncharacterized protein n=1 Tax=Ceriporiopsis subvermispora (strain B) TaxID=914234 RepID=M2R3I2_CERS8|nr:hypothetical protein CERSUDRAFT_99164 [Gelatoporia subvermispora B]
MCLQMVIVDAHSGEKSAGVNGNSEVNNTIVVVHSVGLLDLEAGIKDPNVATVISVTMASNALIDVLYADFNLSGRLP